MSQMKMEVPSNEDSSEDESSGSEPPRKRICSSVLSPSGTDRSSTELSDDDGVTSFSAGTMNANRFNDMMKPAEPSSSFMDSKGHKMMRKMGFEVGKGLGKHAQGRVDPIELSKQRGRRGFGMKIAELDAAVHKWNPDEEVISCKEDVMWLEEGDHEMLSLKTLEAWIKKGPEKRNIEDETHFCDPVILKEVLSSKSVFDKLDGDELRKARTRSNPFETIRGAFFLNRAAMKMANMDKVFDFMFTNPKDEQGYGLLGPNDLLYFADVCAGPGGFSEYVLWRRKWKAKGFGFTLKGENDFRLADFYAGPCETFETHYGVHGMDGDGNIFNPENISVFTEYVLQQTHDYGVHFMMADGGFSVDGQENIQEILSKQLYLCQFLVALNIVRAAIGIKKPNHRKKLKAEIAQLNISDGLPDYIPGSMEEWLRLLRLEEYGPALHQQGYQTVEDVTQLTWEDLEDIGIVKLGHQKKILLAIKRVKDVQAGKRFPLHTTELMLSNLPPLGGQTQEALISTPPEEGDDCFPPNVHTTFHSFHQPWEVEGSQQMTSSYYHHAFSTTSYQPMFCPDIVPIKIRGGRGKSLESLEDTTERTHHTFSAENTQTFYYQQHQLAPTPSGGWRPRSYDDGDITPTNEAAVALHEGGGTLPRPRGLVRPRPVAKIMAKTRPITNDGSTFIIQDFEKPSSFCGTYKSLPRDLIDISKYNLEQYNASESPRCTPKKRPPSPPKRQSSQGNVSDIVIDCSGPVPKASNNTTVTVTVDLHSTASSPSLSLPAYPSGDELAGTDEDLPLPPPPAPASPSGLRDKFEGLTLNSSPPTMSRSWGSVVTTDTSSCSDQGATEQELIASLAMHQSRNGSDASFKSSSSTESDSLPFANENAGTIKQRAARPHPNLTTVDYPKTEFVPPKRIQHSPSDLAASQKALRERSAGQEPADVLNDIGNMLANLTDELDAMLEEEKRQGLSQ